MLPSWNTIRNVCWTFIQKEPCQFSALKTKKPNPWPQQRPRRLLWVQRRWWKLYNHSPKHSSPFGNAEDEAGLLHRGCWIRSERLKNLTSAILSRKWANRAYKAERGKLSATCKWKHLWLWRRRQKFHWALHRQASLWGTSRDTAQHHRRWSLKQSSAQTNQQSLFLTLPLSWTPGKLGIPKRTEGHFAGAQEEGQIRHKTLSSSREASVRHTGEAGWKSRSRWVVHQPAEQWGAFPTPLRPAGRGTASLGTLPSHGDSQRRGWQELKSHSHAGMGRALHGVRHDPAVPWQQQTPVLPRTNRRPLSRHQDTHGKDLYQL